MRDVMNALAELQAAEEAIETAGPLYQTREPLKDKIVCLIGQRSDLITQVLALRRERDAAHARIREIEARAEQAERERDELSANGAAIVGALEERNMARAELDAAHARIREIEARAEQAERELDRVRVDLVTAQHAIGERWFAGGADTATAIERKTKAIEDGTRDAGARAAAAEERAQEAEVRAAALESALREAWRTVRGIANINRFDREVFDDAAAFADWAQSRARLAAERIESTLTPTTPTPAPTLTDAELRALREEGQRRRQRFEEALRRMQVADAQRGGGQ